jgi:hypothetical protein
MAREISDLEQRLQELREAHGAVQTRGQTGIRPKPTHGRRSRRPGRPPGKVHPFSPPSGVEPDEPLLQDPPPKPPPIPPRKPGATKRKFTVTPEVLASRQLQGRYLALIRRMPEGKRKKYAKTAKEKGREAAIKEMTRALKK